MTEKKYISELISELSIIDTQKKILTLLLKPRTIYEIAAKMNRSYSCVSQQLGILSALGHVKKIKKMSGGVIYLLNIKEIKEAKK